MRKLSFEPNESDEYVGEMPTEEALASVAAEERATITIRASGVDLPFAVYSNATVMAPSLHPEAREWVLHVLSLLVRALYAADRAESGATKQ